MTKQVVIKKTDMRIQRTVRNLKRTLIELLKVMPYDKISITDICDKALVHRTTFYKHFDNKEQLLMIALADSREEIFLNFFEKMEFDSPKAIYIYLACNGFEYLSKHKTSILSIYKNVNKDEIFNVIKNALERSIKYLLLKNRPFKNYSIPINVLSTFYTGGLVNLFIWWLNNDGVYTAAEMMKYVNAIFEQNYDG